MICIFGTSVVKDLNKNLVVFNIAIPTGKGKVKEDVLGHTTDVTELETISLCMN